ncbi:hypothetical protein Nepgr_033863 [Nepenthes gracilis]|uniref:Uncharacterized protein n=1 Tax=Nepenthes gracilis TaxID=150966 RepID=A0AAD3TMJ5_NEPGR|nr:hypothetical protein Nepgr_033863 [Nepenthes gracilis]
MQLLIVSLGVVWENPHVADVSTVRASVGSCYRLLMLLLEVDGLSLAAGAVNVEACWLTRLNHWFLGADGVLHAFSLLSTDLMLLPGGTGWDLATPAVDFEDVDVQPPSLLILIGLLLYLVSGCCALAWAYERRAGLAEDIFSGSLRADQQPRDFSTMLPTARIKGHCPLQRITAAQSFQQHETKAAASRPFANSIKICDIFTPQLAEGENTYQHQ